MHNNATDCLSASKKLWHFWYSIFTRKISHNLKSSFDFQFANLFQHNSSAEWCLYISEWASGNWDLSNIRVTTKVAVNALLGDTPTLVEYGSAIMHNLGTREVKAAVRIFKAFYCCIKDTAVILATNISLALFSF